MSTTGRRLHPWEFNSREFILDTWKGTIAFNDEPSTNHLTAGIGYFDDGLRCLIVDLNDIGRRHLEVGLRHIEIVLRDGPKPSLGFYPEDFREYWDDEELDSHWSMAYCGRYELETMLHGRGRYDDLHRAMQHIERLLKETNNLGGKITPHNRDSILYDYLWAAIAADQCQRAQAAASVHEVRRLNHKTAVCSFRQTGSYLRMLWLFVRYCRGETAFENTARKSLENVLALYRDLEHQMENLHWGGPLHGIRWAWLWECLFETQPDVERAVSRLMVFAPE